MAFLGHEIEGERRHHPYHGHDLRETMRETRMLRQSGAVSEQFPGDFLDYLLEDDKITSFMEKTPLAWAETNTAYLSDFKRDFGQAGVNLQTIKTSRKLLSQIPQLLQETNVLIMELHLSLGRRLTQTEVDIPPHLRSVHTMTERGLWLCENIVRQREEARSKLAIIVVSGNLDCDTMDRLRAIGIDEKSQWKKPVEYDFFFEKILGLLGRKTAE